MSDVMVRASGESETFFGAPEWLRVIHEVNRLREGTFLAPESTGKWWAGGYVEEYPDIRVIIDVDRNGNTYPGAAARLVSKTEAGAMVLAQAADNLGLRHDRTIQEVPLRSLGS
jgi:hypothetical protein